MKYTSRYTFIFVIALAPVLFFVEQLTYSGDVIVEKINDRLRSCTSAELGAVSGDILYGFECTSLAYLDEFVITEGQDAVLNLFGKGLIQIKIAKINNSLVDKLTVKSNFSVDIDNPVPKSFTNRFGFSNQEAKVITINMRDYEPGWYEIITKDTQGQLFQLVLFIESLELSNVLFVESTDTLIAYNGTYKNTGIPNNYKRSVSQINRAEAFPKNIPIEYDVTPSKFFPIRCNSHLILADIVLKQHLQRNGVGFTEIADSQLDLPTTYDGVDTIIFGSHNEYWTQDKLQHLSAFVERGGKLLFLGGNQAYREIRRHNDYWIIRNDNFKKDKEVYSAIAELMGTFFKGDMGTGESLKLNNAEIWRKKFKVEINDVDVLGDGSDFSYCVSPYALNPIGLISGASSIETDQLIDGVNGFYLLATGMQENGGADVVYKEFKGGGKILNFSSVGLWHTLSDPYIADLINSFLHKN